MQYVAFESYGSPEVLHVAEMPAPKPASGEVLVAVEAAGISRADVMQRQGNYPPPRDASPILGLEVAGSVAAVGAGVSRWKPGDRVCALTNGGGYAEFVAVPQGQVLPIPQGWSAVEAATLPENAFTVYDNLVTRSRLERGESVLVHGGTSGIGSTAIMFSLALHATPYATAGGAEKVAACLRLGAKAAIDYRTSDFVAEIARLTSGAGVNVVLDIVGGDYVARDVECLSPDGRVVCIATQRGRNVEIDLHRLLAKRATIMGSSLRPRTAEQKAAIARELERRIWPLLPKRDPIVPVVDAVFPFARAAEAHARMEGSAHIGKLVLTPNGTN
ncbi:MAG TPA: NAD(P)H-quinone oxidoreductase [Candidatus Cybelea sp.]|nr:NAD(P)H-quinone oxidoreductase [Candidatus Cybelea sp.]